MVLNDKGCHSDVLDTPSPTSMTNKNKCTVRYEPPKETALDHLPKFKVVVPKHILKAAKMEAKRFPYTFLVSCEFPAGVRVVVVDGFTTALKITFVTR